MAKAAVQRSPERAPDGTDPDDDDNIDEDTGETSRMVETADNDDEREDDRAATHKPDDVDVAEDADADDDDDEVERKARLLGWVPEDEWRSNKQWYPARQFLERGLANSSLNKRNMDKLIKANDELRAKVAGLEETVNDSRTVLTSINDRFKRVDKAAYDRAYRDIEQRRRDAVEAGDSQAFDEAEKQLLNLQKQEKPGDEESATEDKGGDDTGRRDKTRRVPVMAAWLDKNAWFDEHYDMSQAAQGIHGRLKQQHPNWTLERNLEEVTKEIRKRFPERFESEDGDGTRRDTTTTETRRGGNGRSDGRKGRTFSDLPREAQEACLMMIRTIPNFTKREYLETYDWD